MATQAEEAVQLQDTAAERLYPVWQMAVSAARASTPTPPSEPPESVNAATTLALVAVFVAVYASLRRRSPAAADTVAAVPSPGEMRVMAESRADEVAKEIWEASVEHVVTAAPSTDRTFARRASWTTGAASSSSAQQRFSDDLGFTRKVWISRGDAKVRPLHRQLHGKVEDIGTPFRRWPDGQVLEFPGDTRAPPEAWINCRCFLWVAMDKEETEAALGPANLEEAFSLAASAWLYDLDHDGPEDY